ncbi:cysteine desulfurase family protein [Marinococcus halophilus]|uniref:cysteine desulfurase family protein n=1 Tax=Marinococcus halophilus TaxID=1371 RepID=UPI0009A90FF0|nr:aminotransferase class V-fold PLP-dependent enzyme [Marinococcus halophilus]
MLYLDNSSTTNILPEVKDTMLTYLTEEFGNPSSKYYSIAENAHSAIEYSREMVALLIGCQKDEVFFTSGATESNNMILKGIADFYQEQNNHIITTKVEHPAILETCKYLEAKGFEITYLDVDSFGRIDIQNFKEILSKNPPLLVSIIWGNNEIGSLNPISEIAEICDSHNVFFHTDATQVIGKLETNINFEPGINFLSGSAHKLHGPKGSGFVIIRKDALGLPIKLTPLLHGGGQEKDYRSGTHSVHNIVGLGKAAEIANNKLKDNIDNLLKLENELKNILSTQFGEQIIFNNDISNKIPGLLSVQFKGVNNEVLVKNLANDIALSTGSACSSSKPSHVLEACGYPIDQIRSTIRFSLSPYNEVSELKIFERL